MRVQGVKQEVMLEGLLVAFYPLTRSTDDGIYIGIEGLENVSFTNKKIQLSTKDSLSTARKEICNEFGTNFFEDTGNSATAPVGYSYFAQDYLVL